MSGDDTAAGEGGGADPAVDAERLLDALVEEGVLRERADGTLATSEAFAATADVYHDSYGHVSEDVFRRTVAEVFDLSDAAAAERIESEGVTRGMLVTYLAVQSELDGSYSRPELARMAAMVEEVSPDSPIPDAVEHLDDDSYGAFLDDNGRAVVTVWKRNCAPCRAVKRDLDAVLDALPADVAVGGVDGEAVPAFRRAYDVEAAPSLLVFDDGNHVETLRGRFTADQVAQAADRAFD